MSDFSTFKNRLSKNARHWGKWARRQGISCFRVYDRDQPEFPLAVDRYADRAYLAEFDTGWQQTDEEHAAWVAAASAVAAEVLEVAPDKVAFKQRRRQKGTAQYEKTGTEGEDFIVEEGGHRFWVNLDAYLDTGLFLDHRNTRQRVQAEAAGRRFLNLFSYTGSFSVYAAAGGAPASVTVDLSNTYLDWAKRNFELNGMDLNQHQRERADVFQYLDNACQDGEKFDLIVMDPPSFSNSAKMIGVLDVQRDHDWLVDRCLDLLTPGGILYFSTNLRSFKLDPRLAAMPGMCDISAQSVPEDFRNRKIHQCFRFER
ncbi:class I SAM-dependent methyltransferase [Parachitinimonas caeni]|uniref:Class I SAM-dependent methyltransferase n=1 Tax=Parachitinimonas caeni TaxID=3031301 RepID=A0ABT7DUI2_9NEIS|nr:class I SAM-dependent methyltransferase [Parachitinimonas caeni]MDK2123724.1 class I SAM-dependent methyltransferase [Parachitinimonas caeni]